MNVTVNGTDRPFPAGTMLADAVNALVARTEGVAAAVNGELISRSHWPATPLREGDVVEVLVAVQGG